MSDSGAQPSERGARRRRIAALVRKESVQVLRDPSALLIAVVLPVMLLFLFAFAVSLDVRRVRIGVVLESDAAAAQSLAAAFAGTRYFEVHPVRDRREVAERTVAGELRGFVVIPADFDRRLAEASGTLAPAATDPDGAPPRVPALVQIITDGSQPNTAKFVGAYAQGVLTSWFAAHRPGAPGGIALDTRYWFNPEIESRRYLIPGAIAIVMTMIGTLLTALVVAREWERGTMEALLSTPATILEILVAKLLPYFALGLVATAGCTLMATLAFGVPLRGSIFALFVLASTFLVPALGQGLLISVLARNQFVAAQFALISGFLPAMLLSGFLYEIDSMPLPIRMLSAVVPARQFVAALQTVFLAGDVWSQFLPNMAALLAIGAAFFALAALNSRKSLDR